MAFLPEFLADIFVSYSHVDDKPFGPGNIRWVTKFHHDLETRVCDWLGQPITIWRDSKTAGTDVFSDETIDQLHRSAILVSVVTPAYVRSDWCRRELEGFVAANTTVRIRNKSRLVKVLKTFVPRAELPQILDDVLGYLFYKVDPDSEIPREFLIDPSPDGDRAYWAKVDDVAFEIKRLIDLMTTKQTNVIFPSESATAVYLAVSSFDIQGHVDQLRRELEDRGFQVLPERPFPLTSDELIQSVHQEMSRSALSIHPLGARYGLVPENETRSIEELKSFVIDRLRRRAWADKAVVAPPNKSNGSAALGRVYLVYDQRDRAAAAPLHDYLDARGLEVIRPLMNGEPQELREDHQDNLRVADGVLIYWGAASEAWLRAKLRDLARIRGLGRTTPFRANAVYVDEPQGPEKRDFKTRDFQMMQASTVPLSQTLEPFVARLVSNS